MTPKAHGTAAITLTGVAATSALLGVFLPDSRFVIAGAVVMTAYLLVLMTSLLLWSEERERDYYDSTFASDDTPQE